MTVHELKWLAADQPDHVFKIRSWPLSHVFSSHSDRGGAESLMELNGWSSPQMLRRFGASARSARAPGGQAGSTSRRFVNPSRGRPDSGPYHQVGESCHLGELSTKSE